MRDIEILDLISNPDLLPQRSRHYGLFYGFVEDNHDPLKLGRLRVRTPHYYGVPVDSIPWASYASGNSGSDGVGFYFLPPVGSQVVASFIGGAPEYPVWLGGIPSAPSGVAETVASKIDPVSPYGRPLPPGWDYTKVNTITTPGGHSIVLDDNTATGANARRIQLETSSGNFFRMIESRDAVPGVNNPLIELGTVDDEAVTQRRLALDDEAENITITGPDLFGLNQHIIEINTPDQYIKAETGRGYTLILDDANERIDLFTINTFTQDPGHRLRFDNPEKWVEIKTIDDRFGFTSRDTISGHMGMFAPYDVAPGSRKASIVIDRGPYGAQGGNPVIMMTSGDEVMGSNGILVDPGFPAQRPQSVTIYGQGPATSGMPTGFEDCIQLVSKANGTNSTPGKITIGKISGSNTITLTPVSSEISITSLGNFIVSAGTSVSVTSPGVTITGGIGVVTADNQGLELNAIQIMMHGRLVHDYFKHYHEISLLPFPPSLATANPLASANIYKWGVNILAVNPTTGWTPLIPDPTQSPNSHYLVTDFPKG